MRKTVLSLSLTIVGVVFGASTKVNAEIVYSQTLPAMPTAAFSSENKSEGQKIADNFVLSGAIPLTVRSLRFVGGYGLTAPPPLTPPLNALPIDIFRVTFLEDSGGKPGTPVPGGDFTAAQVVVRDPTGGPLLNGAYAPLEYRLNVGSGVMLSPSIPYWLSITNNAGEDFFWDWARASGALDNRICSTFGSIEVGPWETSTSGGMFFELNTAPVPEPSTLMLCTIVMVSNGLVHRSRRHIVS